MNVVVFDIYNRPIGKGLLTHRETIHLTDDNGRVICKVQSPVIVMEDGEIHMGVQCWWMPYDEFVTINQMMLYEKRGG